MICDASFRHHAIPQALALSDDHRFVTVISSSFSSDLPIEDNRRTVSVADSCRRHGIPITPYKRNVVERSVGWRRRSPGGVSETRYCMAT